MKRAAKKNWLCKVSVAVFSLLMVVTLGLGMDGFSIVSYAQSQGKVTGKTVNIRKEPNTTSQKLGSVKENDSVTINHQTTGGDGKIWYQVFVNADTLGYIRSDYVTITDGSTPQTVENSGTTNNNETPAQVTAVNPVSASVKGGKNVRVRGNASTTSQIVTTVASGSALTVNGTANGTDGKVWYQVAFISNGASVTGFIRSDYVEVSGNLTPVTEAPTATEPPAETTPSEDEGKEPEPEVTKAWETQLQGDTWYLLDMEGKGQYGINDMFNAVKQNGAAFEASQKTVKSQKIAIIVLVMIIILLSAAVAFLIFRIKDMVDSEYFSRVERDTVRKRSEERTPGNQKVMHTVGAEKKPGNAATGRPVQGRGAGAPAQGRPAGAPAQGRPAGAPVQGKPAADAQKGNAQNAARKSKNFMADDEEFEFEFLNWDGEEPKQ